MLLAGCAVKHKMQTNETVLLDRHRQDVIDFQYFVSVTLFNEFQFILFIHYTDQQFSRGLTAGRTGWRTVAGLAAGWAARLRRWTN